MSPHGVLLIHKPSGPTSHDVVSQVRKILKTKRIGHAGTLDPLASGLLVLLIGEGTKLSNFLLEGDKSYLATVQLGLTSDTLDITGEVQSTSTEIPPPAAVKDALMSFEGQQHFPIPLYSAVKMQGKRLYAMAREGEAPEQLPTREMNFWGFSGIECAQDSIRFHLHCSKGSFVRSLAAGLGEKLSCGGVLKALERTGSQPYRLSSAVTLEELQQRVEESPQAWEESLADAFMPLAQALPHWPALKVSGWEEKLLLNGQVAHALELKLVHYYQPQLQGSSKGVRVLSRASGGLRALLVPKEGYGFKIQRIFPPAALDEQGGSR